ncbi:MAG: permease [Elusimicrobia bacterium]|nr:permease [Elusimicrobiota bacterium]
MLIPTIIMGVIAVLLFIFAAARGSGEQITAVRNAARLMLDITPMLVFAMLIAGLVQVLIPREALTAWIGSGAGFRGILLGSLAGTLTPGGPYVNMPIAAALLNAGAGAGTMVAFISSWSLLSLSRLPIEVGILGWRFTLLRIACVFFFPPIAGLLADLFTKI